MIVYTENGRGLGLGMEWVACSMRGIRRDDGSQSGVLPKQLRLALPRVDSRAWNRTWGSDVHRCPAGPTGSRHLHTILEVNRRAAERDRESRRARALTSHMVPGHTDGGIILEGRKRATEAAPQRRGLDRQATRDKNGALNEPGIMLRHSA